MRTENDCPLGYFFAFCSFHTSAFEYVRQNKASCGRGFAANMDLYGLGIRTSIYLQWDSALLAKNILLSARQEFQKLYSAFSIAIYLATFVTSFN